jgi:hypothetical protein
MRPASNSESPPRAPAKPNPTSGEDDTMMMGFEFFNEKGQLSPRKILFTEKTCPNKTQRVLSNLFGTIMKWNAYRWAENFLKHAQTSQAAGTGDRRQKIADLLTAIRQSGSVKMTQFFEVSMPVIIKTKTQEDSPATDTDLKNKKAPAFQSAPSFINSEEIIQYYNSASPQKKIPLRNTLIKTPQIKKNESINSIIDKLVNYQKIFSATGMPENKTTKHITSLFESGFLEYCQYGPTAFRNIEIENLDKFLKDYRNNWRTLEDVLNEDQFFQLNEQRKKIIDDILKYKKSNPDHKEKSQDKEQELITTEKITDTEIPPKYNDIPGIFCGKSDVSYQDLTQVDWERDGLYLQINEEDALKIRDYFSIAPLDEEKLQLAKKIFSLSQKIQLALHRDAPVITEDAQIAPQGPGTILSETYGAFLKRYKLKENSDKKSASVVKKSKRKKNEPKKPTRVEKTRKQKKIDDVTEFLQSHRKQLDEANTLIERINKKATISPKKINKNFL